ncbi:type II toxin-antitoxin system RelE/ParE family toxin [Enterobacteriaceae bacterium LUAb1]
MKTVYAAIIKGIEVMWALSKGQAENICLGHPLGEMRLEWQPMAPTDRKNIMNYIGQDNPQAAIDLDDEFERAAERTCGNSDMYKPGRIKGTRKVVDRPHYILVCQTTAEGVLTVLRVPGNGHLLSDGDCGGCGAEPAESAPPILIFATGPFFMRTG